MREELAELWRFRYLLRQFVARELKIRYKNSVFGVLWSIFPPLISVAVYSFVFRGILGVPVPSYSAYLLCGIIPWTFFTTACLDSCQSLLNNFTIMRKVYLPREIIPLAYVISNGIHFLLGWAFYFTAFYLVAPLLDIHIPILRTIVWFPLLLLMEILLVTGLSLWFAALNLFYQDVKYVLQTLFGPLFLVLPVLYPATNIYYALRQHGFAWIYPVYMLNPISAIITGFRQSLLMPMAPAVFNKSLTGLPPISTPPWIYLGAMVVTLLIAWSGYAFFNYRKWQFVEQS